MPTRVRLVQKERAFVKAHQAEMRKTIVQELRGCADHQQRLKRLRPFFGLLFDGDLAEVSGVPRVKIMRARRGMEIPRCSWRIMLESATLAKPPQTHQVH